MQNGATSAQLKLREIIDEYKKEHGEYPDLDYLCKATGKKPQPVVVTLKSIKDYPDELKITPYQKEYLEAYKPGMKPAEMGKLLGITRNQSESRYRRLVEHGLITIPGTEEQQAKEKFDKPQYVRVKEGIVNAGCGGYIKDVKDMPICTLWINGEEVDNLKYHYEELILYKEAQ